jgi:phosphatidylcholine synthase
MIGNPAPPARRVGRKRRVKPTLTGGRFVRLLAWCVHAYTALGLVAAAGIAVFLFRGGPEAFRWSFVLMLVATAVDATDGTMARKVRVKEVVPGFDGRKLDDLTDFLTYTFLPLLLIWRAEILPAGQEFWLLCPLLASAYGFCQVAVKTDDGYFLGFPSLWNIVAFYLYVLHPPGWLALGLLVGLSLLTFVPTRYLYPSQPGLLNRLTCLLSAIWAIVLGWVLWELPSQGTSLDRSAGDTAFRVALISLIFPAGYMIISWAISLKFWLLARARG